MKALWKRFVSGVGAFWEHFESAVGAVRLTKGNFSAKFPSKLGRKLGNFGQNGGEKSEKKQVGKGYRPRGKVKVGLGFRV